MIGYRALPHSAPGRAPRRRACSERGRFSHGLDGVTRADLSYEKREAVVSYDDAKVTVQQMVAAIKTLGHSASVVVPTRGV